MKIYVITDIEGVSGVNGCADSGVGNKIINQETSCRLLTEEINAVIEGLIDGGANEIHVLDGHSGSDSILIENLHPMADLLNSTGGLTPITFVDSTYDAAVQIGAHAMMGTKNGTLNHTFNSHAVCNMWLNGKLIGEIGTLGFQCAYFGVPTIFLSGDRAACHEAKTFFEQIETVETKRGISRYAVLNYNPKRVRTALRETAKKAVINREKVNVKYPARPYELKIQLMCPNMADSYERMGAMRIDHSTVTIMADDLMDLFAQRSGFAKGVYNNIYNP